RRIESQSNVVRWVVQRCAYRFWHATPKLNLRLVRSCIKDVCAEPQCARHAVQNSVIYGGQGQVAEYADRSLAHDLLLQETQVGQRILEGISQPGGGLLGGLFRELALVGVGAVQQRLCLEIARQCRVALHALGRQEVARGDHLSQLAVVEG